MKQPDSRENFISIIVAVFKDCNYYYHRLAERLGISFDKLLQWLTNSPDLTEALDKAGES